MPTEQDREDSARPPSRRGEGNSMAQWHRMAGVGIEFIAAILLCGGIGWWLDGRWNTSPWLLLVGMALGFAVGMWSMIKMARRSFRD